MRARIPALLGACALACAPLRDEPVPVAGPRDAGNIAPGTLRLRAEREGGDGRLHLSLVDATPAEERVRYTLELLDAGPRGRGPDLRQRHRHEQALKDGTVQGVRAGGPAERAGLHDGMRLGGWSVNFGDPDQPIEIDVREDGAARKISFLPHGATVAGYRIRRR